MRIRTRLLLFLMPTLVCSIAIICGMLALNWYGEIVEGFRSRLKSAVITTAAIQPSEAQLVSLKEQLSVSHLYQVRWHSANLESLPTTQKFWQGKDVQITPIYKSENGEKLRTGCAPIFDEQGHVTGLMAADIHVNLIDK